MSTTTVSPSCAARSPAGTSSATEARRASTSASTSSAGTSGSAFGTSSSDQSPTSGGVSTGTVAVKLNEPPSGGASPSSTSGDPTGWMPAPCAAAQYQPSKWLCTASAQSVSRPTRAATTAGGT